MGNTLSDLSNLPFDLSGGGSSLASGVDSFTELDSTFGLLRGVDALYQKLTLELKTERGDLPFQSDFGMLVSPFKFYNDITLQLDIENLLKRYGVSATVSVSGGRFTLVDIQASI